MLTKSEQEKIWVVGSIERLAGLGYFRHVSYNVDAEFIDVYWEIDDNRHEIMDSGEEIFKIILELYPELSIDDATEVYHLLDAYKNSRIKVFVRGMQKICLV